MNYLHQVTADSHLHLQAQEENRYLMQALGQHGKHMSHLPSREIEK